jgi:hypothetical protein
MSTFSAYETLKRIRSMLAFTIQGATRRRLNQHAIGYTFPDGSRLVVYKAGRAHAYRPDGLCELSALIRANAFGC